MIQKNLNRLCYSWNARFQSLSLFTSMGGFLYLIITPTHWLAGDVGFLFYKSRSFNLFSCARLNKGQLKV